MLSVGCKQRLSNIYLNFTSSENALTNSYVCSGLYVVCCPNFVFIQAPQLFDSTKYFCETYQVPPIIKHSPFILLMRSLGLNSAPNKYFNIFNSDFFLVVKRQIQHQHYSSEWPHFIQPAPEGPCAESTRAVTGRRVSSRKRP